LDEPIGSFGGDGYDAYGGKKSNSHASHHWGGDEVNAFRATSITSGEDGSTSGYTVAASTVKTDDSDCTTAWVLVFILFVIVIVGLIIWLACGSSWSRGGRCSGCSRPKRRCICDE